jgi:hypothetical protein
LAFALRAHYLLNVRRELLESSRGVQRRIDRKRGRVCHHYPCAAGSGEIFLKEQQMKNYPDHLDYNDLQAIVASARMERSVAVGDAIASLVAAMLSGLSRAVNAVKSGADGSKSRAAAANAASILEASGRR